MKMESAMPWNCWLNAQALSVADPIQFGIQLRMNASLMALNFVVI